MRSNIVRFDKVKAAPLKVMVTHDQDGYVKLPESLTYKKHDQQWADFLSGLWMGVYEGNGRDTIKLTIHLKLSQADKLMYEFRGWAYYAKQVDGGALTDIVEQRLSDMEFHGIKIKFDIPE